LDQKEGKSERAHNKTGHVQAIKNWSRTDNPIALKRTISQKWRGRFDQNYFY